MERTSPGLSAYERVAEAIKADIRAGTLKPGDRLPGNRSIAEQYKVALGTAQKALGILQDEGVLIAQPAVGVFVNKVPEDRAVSLPLIHEQLDELFRMVSDLSTRVQALEDGTGRS